MAYQLRLPAEKRLSFKILAHKVRAYCPAFVYELLLKLRYAFFPQRCRDLALPVITYSDGSWINRKATSDLLRIEAFLRTQPAGLRLLQIGIGNSSLYQAIGSNCARFVGITVVEDEVRYAATTFPVDINTRYEARLMNKYSTELGSLTGPFDYVIDNDISAYACCHHHFADMLDAYRDLLAPGGAVLVGIKGLGYFDSGFGLTPSMMQRLAAAHGLQFVSGENFHKLVKAA